MAKITKKLEQCVSRGDYYQAQQLCLSLFSRNKRKDPAKAYDTLVSGAKLLFPRGDVTAGSELALTLSKVSEPRPRSEANHTRSLWLRRFPKRLTSRECPFLRLAPSFHFRATSTRG